MQIRLTWINTRRRKIILIFIDLLISIFVYNYTYFGNFNSYPNQVVSLSIGFFWVIFSYILGRYKKEKSISLKSFLISILKVFSLIILGIFIYAFVNWFSSIIIFDKFLIDQKDLLLKDIFIKSISNIGVLSLISQSSISILNYNIYDKKNLWIFYGKKEDFNKLLRELNYHSNYPEISFISASEPLKVNKSKKLKGIIVNDNNILKVDDLDNLYNLKLSGIEVINLIDWFEKENHRIPTDFIENNYQLIKKLKSIEDNFHNRIKRLGDIFVSLVIIVLTLPVIFIVSFLIYLEDKGPIFYTQKRSGLNGKIIKIIKFRSMHVNAEIDGIQWSKNNDKRITRIGRILRALRIDELPQLFCVLFGSMSLIGPRPERPEIEKKLFKKIPYYKSRYILKPGISGWAQVNYHYGASVADTKQKLSYDIFYISNFSFFLDLLIFFKTIKLVLNAKGYKPKKIIIDNNSNTNQQIY
jgi:exopolysaccharide biosynthesis polyprenyl glycosylphosphotransferase